MSFGRSPQRRPEASATVGGVSGFWRARMRRHLLRQPASAHPHIDPADAALDDNAHNRGADDGWLLHCFLCANERQLVIAPPGQVTAAMKSSLCAPPHWCSDWA